MTNQVPTSPKLPIMLGATVAALVLAGCNHAPAPASNQTATLMSQAFSAVKEAQQISHPPAVVLPDPCTLVTPADIQSVVGWAGATRGHDFHDPHQCQWVKQAGPKELEHTIYVKVAPWTGFGLFADSPKIPGIGSEAVYEDAFGSADAHIGNIRLSVQVERDDKTHLREQVIALTKIAAARMH